jgi:hypothetical protein
MEATATRRRYQSLNIQIPQRRTGSGTRYPRFPVTVRTDGTAMRWELSHLSGGGMRLVRMRGRRPAGIRPSPAGWGDRRL